MSIITRHETTGQGRRRERRQISWGSLRLSLQARRSRRPRAEEPPAIDWYGG